MLNGTTRMDSATNIVKIADRIKKVLQYKQAKGNSSSNNKSSSLMQIVDDSSFPKIVEAEAAQYYENSRLNMTESNNNVSVLSNSNDEDSRQCFNVKEEDAEAEEDD